MLTTQESTRTGNMKNEESSNLRRRSPRNTRDGKVCKSKLQEAGAGPPASSEGKRIMVMQEEVRHDIKE
jgi:hypothetical protein